VRLRRTIASGSRNQNADDEKGYGDRQPLVETTSCSSPAG
jgi:hypothetical protein